MSFSRLWRIRKQLAPRLVSLAVLFGVLCSVIPMPAGQRISKDLSEPFPCQQRACGCRSAAQCWKKCCCFTNTQKVAWAKKHKVVAPAFVLASAKRESTRVKPPAAACCPTGKTHTAQCAATPATASHKSASRSAVVDVDQSIYVIAALAEQCQGQPWFWSTLPWAIMPQLGELRGVAALSGEKSALISAARVTSGQRPPVPPPRQIYGNLSAV